MPLLNVEKNFINSISSFSTADIQEIENYLVSNPSSSIYHHPLYLKVLSEETSRDYTYMVYKDNDDKIKGILPLLVTRGIKIKNSPLGRKRISSLPRTPFAGPLADDMEVYLQLLKSIRNIADNKPEYLVQIKSAFNLGLKDIKFSSTGWRKTYIKKISPAGQKIHFEDNSSIKRGVNRAAKEGVKIKKCKSLYELKLWYKLYLDIMRQHGIPPRSFKLFELFWNILKPAGLLDINFAVIEEEGKEKIINGNVNFKFNKNYFGGFKAGDMKKSSLMGGDYLLYNELMELQQEGFKTYDLGEAGSDNQNLIRYKKKWGTEEVQLYHNYYGDISELEILNLESGTHNGLLTKIWQKLPLPIIQFAGGLVNSRL